MAHITRKCWLTFESGCQDQPCLWRMSRQFPEVTFDIRQASVTEKMGIMAVLFEGDADDVQSAMDYLISQGVRVDPVEGGGLVAG